MKKLVMFDMDGVLFDTMPRHAKAWKQTMDRYGVNLPEAEFFLHEGRTGKGTIEYILGPEADYESIYKEKCAAFDLLPEGGQIPGAKTVVEAIRALNVDAIVVTGSGQVKSIERLDREYPGLFIKEWMVTGRDVKKGKPDPEPYLMGLRKAGVSPSDAVIIENAPLGVQSGHASGCFVVAVNTGPLPNSSLLDAGADVLCKDMKELLERLPEILA